MQTFSHPRFLLLQLTALRSANRFFQSAARGTSGGGGSASSMIHLDTNYLIGLLVKASSCRMD
jgi:hypothetical protein